MTSTISPIGILLLLTRLTNAQPIGSLRSLSKRGRSTGATVGLAVGIAVAAILVIAIITFLIFHFRRSNRLEAFNKERAILAGEKNADGSDKPDKFAPEPAISRPQPPPAALKRNKSVKDRLMGPLYRGSTIELPERMPYIPGANGSRDSAIADDGVDGMPLVKPWVENSPRPSFSSRRATRMMMMM